MCFHYLNDGSLNGIPSIILYFTLNLSGLCLFVLLGPQNWDLIPVQIALILQVHEDLVLCRELLDLRFLCQNFVLN